MDVSSNNSILKKIKNCLVFFCVLSFLIACKQQTQVNDIKVHYDGNKALSVHFIGVSSADYQIVKKENPSIAILGELNREGDTINFTPVIPLTNGLEYQIFKDDQLVGVFNIKNNTAVIAPRVDAIYPKLDTVPENLLKMYIVFSKPMQEIRNALDYIKVVNLNTQKEEFIFLSLETELWNAAHTELTLWLDPGRIKKDLIPNKTLGIPIREGNRYELRISPDWSDAEGVPLGKESLKKMVVGKRETQIPTTKYWKFTAIPPSETGEALDIHFGKPMDLMLTAKSLEIVDANQQTVAGDFIVNDHTASTIIFIPKKVWKKGKYTLLVERTFEDLAGNNMFRLFDTDLQQYQDKTDRSLTKEIPFTIQ